jgi:hypothetical protein
MKPFVTKEDHITRLSSEMLSPLSNVKHCGVSAPILEGAVLETGLSVIPGKCQCSGNEISPFIGDTWKEGKF